jgi:hypothetical protein
VADKIAFATAPNEGIDDDTLYLFSADGTELWSKSIYDDGDPPLLKEMGAVAVDPDGNVYTCGRTPSVALHAPLVQKYTSAGVLVWSVQYPDNWGTFFEIAVMPDRRVLIGGERQDLGAGEYGTVFCLAAADGSTEWYADLGDGDWCQGIASDASGNVYALSSNIPGHIWSWEADGTPRWDVATDEALDGIAVDPTGTWLYVGLYHDTLSRFDTLTGVEDTGGSWPIALDISVGTYLEAISCDKEGYLYVGHSSIGVGFPGPTYTWGVRKYSAAAELVWDVIPSNSEDVWDVSVSSTGYVYVTGGIDTVDNAACAWKLLAETGAEIPLGWPKEFYDYDLRVAATLGCVGAFPNYWLPAANIYVGDVLFE